MKIKQIEFCGFQNAEYFSNRSLIIDLTSLLSFIYKDIASFMKP
jgi:hypothetical protein